MPIRKTRNIKDLKAKLEKIHRQAATVATIEAENYSKEAFRKQGWDGKKWEGRKNPSDPKNKGRALLVKTGRLSRSPKRKMISTYKGAVETSVPYARPHNEGARIRGIQHIRGHKRRTGRGRSNVKPHSRKIDIRIPRRQFLGNSKELSHRIKVKLTQRYRSAL